MRSVNSLHLDLLNGIGVLNHGFDDDDIYFFVRRHGRPHGANSSNVLYSALHRNTADLA